VVVHVSYCGYNTTARRLTRNGIYCASTGAGDCINDVIQFSNNRLVYAGVTVPDGSACPSRPVKYDSTVRRLVRGTETHMCQGYL
jgi:hypothetical protein